VRTTSGELTAVTDLSELVAQGPLYVLLDLELLLRLLSRGLAGGHLVAAGARYEIIESNKGRKRREEPPGRQFDDVPLHH
jgi:hypothetical protein